MKRVCIVAFALITSLWGCSEDDSTICVGNTGDACKCADGRAGTVGCNGACGCEDTGTPLDAGDERDATHASDMTPTPDMAADAADVADAASDAGSADTGADMFAAQRGTCTVDDDCDTGSCERIPDVEGGWHTCVYALGEPSSCDQTGPEEEADLCCLSQDCSDEANGACVAGPIFYCGGAAPIERNTCLYPECDTDGDCNDSNNGICVPAGALGEPVARCSYGDCAVNDDCDSRAGGECSPFFDPCNRRFIGFHCTYADSVCRTDGDCPSGGGFGEPYCAPGDDGATSCESFVAPP